MRNSASIGSLILMLMICLGSLVQALQPTAAQDKPKAEPAPNTTTAAPTPDFSRISDRKVAEELKLTDEQRAKVTAILKERDEAAAKAAEADRGKIRDEYAQKLAALLTDEQRSLLIKLKPEARLRFNFRFQRWVDVLQWFAEQADVSLVLDAPPPGTFNYTDNREYTPTEAIDLLNGVLQTKDFTLVRRGRMLLVVDLKDGIPEGVAPRIDLSELDTRGKFELVSILFPLGNRNAEEVDKEIKPLLGRRGKSVPLPKTKQILITDMSGAMRAINAVITSIPEPAAPPKPPEPPPPEKPALTVYTLNAGDPKAVVETLKALVPGANVVYDPESKHLNAFATPSQHAAIKPVIEQMQAKEEPGKPGARLELYPVEATTGAQILDSLRLVAPDAQLRLDTQTNQIVAFAEAGDHDKLKSAIEKLQQGGLSADKRQLEVYRLTKADPTATQTLLSTLLPHARITVDPQTKNLVALAAPDDQRIIKVTLDQLQPEKPGPDTPELRAYPQKKPFPANLITVLQSLVPKAQITNDTTGRQLLVVASPADHAVIDSTITRVMASDEGNVERQRQLEVYRLTKADPSTTLTLLQTLLPTAQLSIDAQTKSLIALAIPDDQRVIKTTLEQLQPEQPGPDVPVLRFYPQKKPLPANVVTVLQNLVPKAQITNDVAADRLLVVAAPADHQIVEATLARFAAEEAAAPTAQNKLELYRVSPAERKRLQAVLDSVSSELPGIRIINDAEPGEMAVWAKPDQHALIADVIEKIKRDVPEDQKYQLVAYSIKNATPQSVLTVLQELYPNTRIVLDAKASRLLIWTRPEEHESIKQSIERVDAPGSAEAQEKLMLFPVTEADPSAALSTVQPLVPDARLTLDSANRMIVAWARQSDLDKIRKTLDQFRTNRSVSQVYRFETADPNAAYSVLTTLVPQARMAIDSRTRSLVVSALPEDHEKIKGTLEQMDKPGDGKDAPVLHSYPLKSTDASTALSTLQNLFTNMPEVRLSADYRNDVIVAFAPPKNHESIQATLDELQKKDSGRTSQVYPLVHADPSSAYSILSSITPRATITIDSKARRLVVSAFAADHEKIRATLEQMDKQDESGQAPILRSYTLKSADISSALSVLQNLFATSSDVRLSADYKNDTIVAFAPPKSHETIQASLDELQKKDSGRTSQVYSLKYADPSSAYSILSSITPRATITIDSKARRLVVSAFAADHEKIRATLEQMDKQDDNGQGPVLRSYRLSSAEATGTLSMLQTLFATFPEVRLSADYKTQTIVAFASPAQHETIAKSIQEIDSSATGRVLAVYRFRSADPNAAATVLNTLTPKAQVAVDNYNRTLVVSAAPEDQERIKKTVEEIDGGEGTAGGTRQLVSYPLKSADTSNTYSMLATLFAQTPEVRISPDYKNDTIVALATAEQHKTILKAIDEIEKKETGRTPKVYRFKNADPYAASTVLATLTPKAQVAVDSRNRTLVVSASAADHEKIAATVAQMDARDDEGQTPALRTYPLTTADPNSTVSMLQTLFATYPEVRISLDTRSDTIVALASAAQHEKIRQSIDELEKKGSGRTSHVYQFKNADPQAAYAVLVSLAPRAQMAVDLRTRSLVASASAADHEKIKATVEQLEAAGSTERAVQLVSYKLQSADPASLITLLQPVFATQPEVRFSIDARNNTLVAIGTSSQHQTIRQLIEQVDREAADRLPEVEVFQLEVIEPFDAELAISRLFGRDGLPTTQEPVVDSNVDTHQLFVRAEPKQLEEIRRLLVKMGEVHLAKQDPTSKRRIRVIPFDGDAAQAIEQIRGVWPQLRRNEIRVVTPSAVAPLLRQATPPKEGEKPAPGKDATKSDQENGTAKSKEEGKGKANEKKLEGAAQFSVEDAPRATEKAENSETKKNQQENDSNPAAKPEAPAPAPDETKPKAAAADQPPAPVLIAPGDRSITIASDDPEALDQIESLLRAMSSRGSARGRDYIVFQLRNSSAERVAATLQQVFRTGAFGGQTGVGSGRVVVVPDERLNAIVVHANRSDRETIEELLRILDTADVTDTFAANKPKRIPVKNTEASRIEDMLRDIYQTQLKAGGGGRPIPVPSGVSPQVAAAIQQANAAREAPLLTLGVDEQSNSLIVLAPANLTTEIEQLVAELDTAAVGDSAKGLRVIQLQKTNSKRVRQALNLILEDAQRGGRGSRSRRNR